jgi:hypothetical protein
LRETAVGPDHGTTARCASPLTRPRLHSVDSRAPAPDHRPVRRKLASRALASVVSCRPLRLRSRPELWLPPVMGMRRDSRSSSHRQERTGARHGYRDARALETGWLARREGKRHDQSQGEECQCQNTSPQRPPVKIFDVSNRGTMSKDRHC